MRLNRRSFSQITERLWLNRKMSRLMFSKALSMRSIVGVAVARLALPE